PLAPQQRGRGLPPIEGAGYTGAPSRMQGGRAPTAFPLRRVSSVFPELCRSGTSIRIGQGAPANSISRRDETPPAAATPSEAAARVLIRLRRTRMRKTAY